MNAFRKSVLMCAKNGVRFCDAAGVAFGRGDSGKVAEQKKHGGGMGWLIVLAVALVVVLVWAERL